MPKALIVNPYWDSLGGGERYTASFAKLLSNHGWQVDILWPQNLTSQIKSRFGIDLSSARWLNKSYYSQFSIPYSLIFWLSDGSLPISFAKKTLIHMQFPFQNVGGTSLPNFLKSRFYKFVVNSQFTKGFIDREYKVSSRVIYPPVDVAGISPDKKTKTILYVGRFSNLTQKKGQDVLISAFSEISSKLPGWKLILAGGTTVGTDTAGFAQLKKSAAKLPVEFITDPKLAQLQKIYSQSRIFWSASGYGADETTDPLHVEHFGISLVEAMAAGCVPVVTRLGGHREIVSQGADGFTWDQPQELIDYTLQLAESRNLLTRLSRNAIAKSHLFSVERFNETFLDLVNPGISR